MTVVKFKRDGKDTYAQEHLMGKRQEHSLCWQGCKHHKPHNVLNCPIAEELYVFSLLHGLRTAVWECQKYQEK